MRRLTLLLTLALFSLVGCRSTSIPGSFPIVDLPKTAVMPDIDVPTLGPAVARDYGNKLTL